MALICLASPASFPAAAAIEDSDLSAKGKLTFVAGSGVDEIYRAEGWLKHEPSFLDLKLKLEQKNQSGLVKARLQFLPFALHSQRAGFAARYQREESADAETGVGMAVRFKGERWNWPIRYYWNLHLFHSKPVIRFERLNADCQIVYDLKNDEGSLRPGIDWSVTNYFTVGFDGRAYTETDKNYLGLRVSLRAQLL